jgi:hypothetical protein
MKLRNGFLAQATCLGLAVLLAVSSACRDSRDSLKNAMARDYACRIGAAEQSLEGWEGELFRLRVEVANTGRKDWISSGLNPVLLSYHLLDQKKHMLRRDNTRISFSSLVPAGGSTGLALVGKAPLSAGRYFLELDLVQEGVSWFKDLGSKTSLVALEVKPRPWPENSQPLTLDYGRFTNFQAERKELAALLKLIRITLNHNDLTLKGRTGRVEGFRAGAGYPQVWLRDANSIIPASRWFYNRDHLDSWLREHLAYQREDGSLFDWFDLQGRTDKNTVETDQESSAVQAAGQAAALLGPGWLQENIQGRTILDRLERALRFVLAERFDDKTGLVFGAHTIDWGDVEEVDSDQQAIYLDARSRLTADIYDQAMFYQAARELAAMMEAAGLKEKAMFWTVQADSLRKKTNERLWQPGPGFYRVHIHLDPKYIHDFPEDEMFALGGNVTAVQAGLADETQRNLILKKALELQKTYGLPTIGGVLLPPYPAGVFKHPAVDEPYEYQNGGQWDWFGGKLVYALFDNGFSRAAKDKLREIILKNLRNGGLSEWDDPAGSPRGSDFYSGSAGSLAKALLEGYFGLRMSRSGLSLEPRLAGDNARVHAYLPAADLFLAYEHRVLGDGRTLVLNFNSNFTGLGTVKVLLPWMYVAGSSREASPEELTVTLDGRPVAFRKTRVEQDEFVIVQTDFKNHRLKIKLK